MRQRGVPGQGEAPAEGSVTTRLDAAEAKGPEQCVEQESGTTLLGSILHALSFFLFAVGGLLLQAALTQGLQAASLSVLGSTIVWGESFHQATRLGSVFLDMLCLLPMLVFLIAWHVKATPAKVVQWLVTPHISRFGLGLIVYNFIGFLALVAYQYNTVWYLSLSNFRLSAPRPSDSAAFIVPDATRACHEDSACLSPIDWSSVVTLCLHAPLAEELLFRAGLFIVTLRRNGNVVWCAALSSALFAGIHLLNASSHKYDNNYVLLQSLAAFFVGCCLCLRLAVTGSPLECLALHVSNNLLASFIATDGSVDFADRGKMVPLIHTFLVYIVCCGLTIIQLRNMSFEGFQRRHPLLFSATPRHKAVDRRS